MRVATRFGWALITCATFAVASRGDDPADEGRKLYESRIKPVFVMTCWECHSAKAKTPKAGLRLDTRDLLIKGGDSGPAIVSKKPDDSLLIHVLEHSSEIAQMPPGRRLPDPVVEDFRRWVELGAPYGD
jgi:hypothetical protein